MVDFSKVDEKRLKTVNVRIEPSLLQDIKKLAYFHDVTMSVVVREFVKEGMKRHKSAKGDTNSKA